MDAILRNTFANIENFVYRLRAAGTLLGVSDNTLRTYSEVSGIRINRASDITPGAPSIRVFDIPTLFQLALWRRSQGYVKSTVPGTSPVRIVVDAIKGGTGKSTTAAELTLHLQLLGLNVLLIDLDTQANVTQLFGYEADLTEKEAANYGLTQQAIVNNTFASLMTPYIERVRGSHGARVPDTSNFNVIKHPFGEYGPALIPADTYLGDIEHLLLNAKGNRELYVKNMLDAAFEGKIPGLELKNVDVIIFDSPPAINLLSTNALAAADLVIAPIKMDSFSVKGLSKLLSEINMLESAYKTSPEILILPTHYSPYLSRVWRMQSHLQTYKDYLSPCLISASEEFSKSIENYMPLTLQKPTSHAAKEYRIFAELVHAKILKISANKAFGNKE